jgi:hypothetical protein
MRRFRSFSLALLTATDSSPGKHLLSTSPGARAPANNVTLGAEKRQFAGPARQVAPTAYWKSGACNRDLEITTELTGQGLVDPSLPRNSGRLSGDGIDVHGVVFALTQQAASL